MERAKIIGPRPEEFETKVIEHANELESAMERTRETGTIDVIVWPLKPGVTNVGVVTSENGSSVHLANAIAASKVVLVDAARFPEYPDIIIRDRNFTTETLLKKLSEYLFRRFQMQDIRISVYKTARSFKQKEPLAIIDPKAGILEIAA